MATVIERVPLEQALERVRSSVGEIVADLKINLDNIDLACEPAQLQQVVERLRDDPDIRCEYFTFLSAVDRSEFGGDEDKESRERYGSTLELLVHLYSPSFVIPVNVHVPLDPEDPVVPSITGLFRGANWHERETHEMFGVEFEGHPRLVNLYLPEDFEGHPGLRSFKLPSRIVKEWPGAKDPEEAAAGGR
jgi:NADH-quinone oxidoreductase subunit C